MACNDSKKFKTSEESSKASLRTKGAIDENMNILKLDLFNRLNSEWSNSAKIRFNISENLFSERNMVAIPNSKAFEMIDEYKSIQSSLELSQSQNNKEVIKPGVPELFESNPELANAVYEDLGFKTNSLQAFKDNLINIIGVDKVKELYAGTDVEFNSFTIDDVELGTDKSLIVTIKTDKGQRTAINLRLDGDYQYLKISEGNKTVKGIYAPLSEKKTAIDFLINEFKNLNIQEATPQQKQQAQQLYSQYLDTIFLDSKGEEMDNNLYISVLNDLKSQKIIDKQCS